MHPLVAPLLSFLGALVGALGLVRYSRHTSYEKTVGELYAKRRLELVDEIAHLLQETIEILDLHEGVESTAFKEVNQLEILDELRKVLPLAEVYLEPELHSELRAIHFWTFLKVNPHTNYMTPKSEPNYQKAWTLLAKAGRLKA